MPSTRTGVSSFGAATATTTRRQVFQVMSEAADTSATDRYPPRTAAAMSALAADGEPGPRRDLRHRLA